MLLRRPSSARAIALAVLLMAELVGACDVCDGLAASKVASGEVLDISDEGLRRLASSHTILALLLYHAWDAKSQKAQKAYDEAALAFKREGSPIVMAQIDVRQFPAAAAFLHVTSVQVPAMRILRGDHQFGYPLQLQGNGNAADIVAALRAELSRASGSIVSRLSEAEIDALGERPDQTYVVANVSDPRNAASIEQVAHALHGAVNFVLLAEAPPSSPLSGASSRGSDIGALAPPRAPPCPRAADDADTTAAAVAAPPSRAPSPAGANDRIRLVREASVAATGDDAQAIELPLNTTLASRLGFLFGDEFGSSSGALTPFGIYSWVRWAALPSVFELSPSSAPTYLSHGASGIVFAPGVRGSNKTREYVRRRLRRVADRLRADADHGLWLLWADSYDREHARLRMQLGLAPVGTAAGDSETTGNGGATRVENDFAIVVMAGGRISARFVMPAPFSFDRVGDFAAAFARGQLQRAARRADLMRSAAQVACACAAVIAAYAIYRRKRGGDEARTTKYEAQNEASIKATKSD